MSGTVTVACKMPNGLILQNYRMTEQPVPVMGGGMRMEKIAQKTGPAVKINGPATPVGMAPRAPMVGGYALTHNVDADVWEQWLANNLESDLVKNKIIFAHEKKADTSAQAREQRSVLSGLEPINLATKMENGKAVHVDPRWPKSLNPNLSEVETNTKDFE